MKIIAVFKTHVDIGFTDLPRKVLKSYSSDMLLRVVEMCENTVKSDNPFVWTMPAFVLHYVLRNCTKELRVRTEKLIKKGRIVWHALPLTLRTEFFTKKELKETLFYAKDLCERYDKPMPISAKMTDVPGHTQALVDILCDNGVKFLHLGCNPASTPPEVPRLFFWESKTGKRILTYYDIDYGGKPTPPENWKYPVFLSMNANADNKGVQDNDIIGMLDTEVKKYDSDSELVTGTMDDFANELLKCDLSDLPVIKGELGDTRIDGIGAFPSGMCAIGEARKYYEKIRDTLCINYKSFEVIK